MSLTSYLKLGRVSNLSTVWSNVYCAWIICGNQSLPELTALLLGSSLLYTAGMFMNDLCDLRFDRSHRRERPIPSGAIASQSAARVSFVLFAMGFASIAWISLSTALFTLGLVATIAAYNLAHKKLSILGPPLMAGCRALLYFIVGSSVLGGVDSILLTAIAAIFIYVLGITLLARSEATSNHVGIAGLIAIALPIGASFFYRADLFEPRRGAVIGLLIAWIALVFLRAKNDQGFSAGKTIGPLLAAIPLMDLLALSCFGFATYPHMLIFCAFFAIAIVAQRVIPAS